MLNSGNQVSWEIWTPRNTFITWDGGGGLSGSITNEYGSFSSFMSYLDYFIKNEDKK